ncbi:MAG TPA: polyprenyl diphosphate synthase [Myxococcales bacterium LLY-WYZ-16_1]|jgi:undecaprenyl diphosphate synthase|nr:polyprenyl diphosphate synthase [Myxococcales bacterium LLY-WYZ-16_1]
MTEGAPKRLPPGPLPRHVAIIMDGNGRWAELRGRPRYEGHAYGAQSVRRIVTCARENGIEALTLYAFSVQNWGRPKDEVERLMSLLLDYLVEERETILENQIRLQGIGQLERLPETVRKQLHFLQETSQNHEGMVLTLALSYGGREEIVDACRSLARDVADGRLDPDAVDEAVVDRYMFTRGLPPLDLLIRTSGEMRLSNFLLWQSAYAEIVVADVLWPDFDEGDFFRCIETFRGRQRRFGRTGTDRG